MSDHTKNKFILYQYDGGDAQILDTVEGRERNDFIFLGLNIRIHPYHKKQLEWLDTMLEDVGIYLNRKTLPGEFPLDEPDGYPTYIIPSNLMPSANGKTYFHIQDSGLGRGYAELLEIDNETGRKRIIFSDHRDNVRDALCWDWAIEQGADLKIVLVDDIDEV